MSVLNETDIEDGALMSEPKEDSIAEENNEKLLENSHVLVPADTGISSRYENTQITEGNEAVAFNTGFEKKKATVALTVKEDIGIQTD